MQNGILTFCRIGSLPQFTKGTCEVEYLTKMPTVTPKMTETQHLNKLSCNKVTKPFDFGWMREIVYRATVSPKNNKKNLDIYYFTPEGNKLRSMPEIKDYLEKHTDCGLQLDNFTFSKMKIYKFPFEKERTAKGRTQSLSPPVSSESVKHKKTKSIEEKQSNQSNESNEIEVISCHSSDSEAPSPEKLQTVSVLDDIKPSNGVIRTGKYRPVKFPFTVPLVLAENEMLFESPSLQFPLCIREVNTFPSTEQEVKNDKMEEIEHFKETNGLPKNFFQSSAGRFISGLGQSRVQEWCFRDMKHSKLKRMKKLGLENGQDETYDMYHKAHSQAKAANSVFNFRLHQCQICDFKSESRIVMESHYLTPHVTPRKEYRCSFCPFLSLSSAGIVSHFKEIHGKKAVLTVDFGLHECPFCCFQSFHKAEITAHIQWCRNHFSFSRNQEPSVDYEFPGVTMKPLTVVEIMAYRALRSNNKQIFHAGKKMTSILNKGSPNGSMNGVKNAAIIGESSQIHVPLQKFNIPPSHIVKGSSGNIFVLCEICDSSVKNLKELQIHMYCVHKVKINSKRLNSRPPLNCQKCQWRFFTDHGLERHLLGTHGLVTTHMQEMADKNQDGGTCIICGAMFAYKMVSHMIEVHKVVLKPARLTYRCTVCGDIFLLYGWFESHVRNVHNRAVKRPGKDSTSFEPIKKKICILPAESNGTEPILQR